MIKKKSIHHLRNIGIMAHIDAGKTTTTERILYLTGLTHKLGEVHEGTAVMDWMVQEQERGITITSAATSCQWKDYKINILDTPGHVDFTVEVERCLRILDSAIFLLDAKEGVEAQTEAVWHQASHYHIPKLIFINKMDVIGANFLSAVHAVKKRLHPNPIPLFIPIGAEKDFTGIISLIDMKAYYYDGEYGEIVTVQDIPNDHLETTQKSRTQMLEELANFNDTLMMLYLENRLIDIDFLKECIRQATLSGEIVPVLCGAAYRNKGVQSLLDAIIDFLPSPLDRPPIEGHDTSNAPTQRLPSLDAPFSALIFKIMTDPYVGKLAYFRVYSGQANRNHVLYNLSKSKKERINKFLEIHANNRYEIESVSVGDIAAVVGLKHSTTGDTLSNMNAPIILENIEFPEPVISRAVEPKTPGDYDKLEQALKKLVEEDPTLSSYTHSDTGQILISGMGELHLEIIIDRLIKEFGVHVNTGKPMVTYRETISQSVDVVCDLAKRLTHQTLNAYVALHVTPATRGTGHSIEFHSSTQHVPPLFLKATENGIKQSLGSGVIGGYEVVDLKIEVTELKYQEEQSTDVAFITAASYAINDALKQGVSVLLEPIFSMDIHVPEAYIGDVIDDLNKRKGVISEMKLQPNGRLIKATAPLSKLFGYTTELRSITHGHGHHTLIFHAFEHLE